MRPQMARHRARYPLTSYLVTQSLLGVLIRMVDNMIDMDPKNPRFRRSILVESVTALEQFLRLYLESRIAESGKSTRVAAEVEGIDGRVEIDSARIDAAQYAVQSVAALRRIAAEHNIPAVAKWLEGGGAEALDRTFYLRHALVHTVGLVEFDEAEAVHAGVARSGPACRQAPGKGRVPARAGRQDGRVRAV